MRLRRQRRCRAAPAPGRGNRHLRPWVGVGNDVRDVFEKDQPQHDMLIFGSVHVVA